MTAKKPLRCLKNPNMTSFSWTSICRSWMGLKLRGVFAIWRAVQNPTIRKIPIVAMTASAMTQDIERTQEAGMNDYVAKPIDVKQLFSTLVKWIEPGEREIPECIVDEALDIKCEEKEPDLSEIQCIDVNSGLMRVGGNKKLYLNILTKFFRDYPDAAEQIKEALDNGDKELSQRLAHTVKGVAGNIGANDLQEAGGSLEAAIKHQKTDEFETLLDGFRDALNVVINSLKNVIEVEDKAEKEKPEGQIGETKETF